MLLLLASHCWEKNVQVLYIHARQELGAGQDLHFLFVHSFILSHSFICPLLTIYLQSFIFARKQSFLHV